LNPTPDWEASVKVLADSRGNPRLNGSVRSAVVDLKKSMTFWVVETTSGADVRLKAVTNPKESVKVAEDSLGNPRPNELVMVAVDSLGMPATNWTVESAVAEDVPVGQLPPGGGLPGQL
jgi:predicted Zn-dependent protease